jgi:hypothetical protein
LSARTWQAVLRCVAAGVGLALLPAGCAYDYLQHTDRIAYKAGDAVHANLESETIDPSKRTMYSKRGLGKDGAVIPADAEPAASAPAAAAKPVTATN